jgi:hypothetical protein
MKKSARAAKITLHRETLRFLDADLRSVGGFSAPGTCTSVFCYTPNTECVVCP